MDSILYTPTDEEIWAMLSPINVNAHTKEKNGLTFLSWTYAWATMKNYFPQIKVEWRAPIYTENCDVIVSYRPIEKERGTTAMVHCDLYIGECQEYAWLPVMDAKMNATLFPNSRDVSDSMMRCMVKGFAFFGLGHYIYAGEDIPTEQESVEAQLIVALKRSVAGLHKGGYVFSPEVQDEIKEVIDEGVASTITALKERLEADAQIIVGAGS